MKWMKCSGLLKNINPRLRVKDTAGFNSVKYKVDKCCISYALGYIHGC